MSTSQLRYRHISHPVVRDLPHSVRELTFRWLENSRREVTLHRKADTDTDTAVSVSVSLIGGDVASVSSAEDRRRLQRRNNRWAIFTTGAGLFSDGYVNNSIGVASSCLKEIYGKQYTDSRAISNVSSIAFAGTVFGQLSFGYFADRFGRKISMLVGTAMLIIFTILTAGAWGVGTSDTNPGGLFEVLAVYRFLVGIAIGSEYSSGSPAAAEASNALPAGRRNRWFCWFTNFMIDLGFVVSAVVPWVLLYIFGEKNLTPVWRITLALGAVPPLSLYYMRTKFKESEGFEKTRLRNKMPYWRVVKFYWFRTSVISLLWFIYDFSAYAFGTYSTFILGEVLGKDAPLKSRFAWNILFNFFYLPGAFLGAIFSDYLGPRLTFTLGIGVQSLVGFAIAGFFGSLRKNIAAFTIVYGVFMTLGEFGPGDNIGVLASKTTATPVRGQLYGIAAAIGKVGAFVGAYVFPIIIKKAGGESSTPGLRAPYLITSSLFLLSAFIALVFLPPVHQEAVDEEDRLFVEYLQSTGYEYETDPNIGEAYNTTTCFDNSPTTDSPGVDRNSKSSANTTVHLKH
ncbi:uncharacterized protein Ecym_4062 [Eremothecium cymbalariae DBVPG|uniref:Major facilitator superfamily (MFS) profile domain-containing protein n=1 Tax=Eremothecium cymbalariae (strain CBS 270.75 / DBVPG 7215 / KCTC 17166 / NRRL Y-17582) TaxID=931890 RepID=G8JSY9_ERECY|nr:hypothetical protein Ecym_4062 [Eremothecium cymbalariae DBVPG\